MNNRFLYPFSILALATMTACGGSGSSGNGGNGSVSASDNADRGSSYENSKTDILIRTVSDLPLQGYDGQFILKDAVGYLDANNDGHTDVFVGTGQYLIEDEVPSQLFINNGSGAFELDNSRFEDGAPPATHARKTLVADFNGDSLKDMMILDHGYDAEPFPGSTAKLVLQGPEGEFTWEKLSPIGFYHGGAAGDFDNDGDIDVFVGNNAEADPFFYINDGTGSFSVDRSRLNINLSHVFTAELIDIDQDGFLDLIAGGNEQQVPTTVYWGGTSGNYGESRRTRIRPIENYQFVNDFDAEDVDGDGDRDVVINRTSSSFAGRAIQVLEQTDSRTFDDVTSQNVDDSAQPNLEFVPWLRVQDVNDDGHRDIFSDDLADDWLYLNDGDGNFSRTSFSNPEASTDPG